MALRVVGSGVRAVCNLVLAKRRRVIQLLVAICEDVRELGKALAAPWRS